MFYFPSFCDYFYAKTLQEGENMKYILEYFYTSRTIITDVSNIFLSIMAQVFFKPVYIDDQYYCSVIFYNIIDAFSRQLI